MEITYLSNPQSVGLMGNQIQIIPKEVAHISELESLNLANNPLKDIAQLKKLRPLNLSDTELPTSLKNEIKMRLPHTEIFLYPFS